MEIDMATKNPVMKSTRPGSITVTVADVGGSGGVLSRAYVSLYRASEGTDCSKFNAKTWKPDEALWLKTQRTDGEGQSTFTQLDPGPYVVVYEHHPITDPQCTELEPGCADSVCFHLPLEVEATPSFQTADCQTSPCPQPRVGDRVIFKLGFTNDRDSKTQQQVELIVPTGASQVRGERYAFSMPLRRAGQQSLKTGLRFNAVRLPPGVVGEAEPADYEIEPDVDVDEREPTPIGGNVNVSMTRTETEPTSDLKLWGAIRASTDALSFDNYLRFMDLLFCGNANGKPPVAETAALGRLLQKRFLPFTDTDAYRVMKAATEAFVMVNCGVFTGDGVTDRDTGVLANLNDYLDRRDLPKPGRFPYLETVDGIRMLPYLAIIRRKLPDVSINTPLRASASDTELCDGFVQEKLSNPCLLELIWSYWHEEGMQVQTMNAITRRFQNIRGNGQVDPLSNMEINPLRPLNNLLWGFIQDEQHRLTVARRNGEYHHHYGLQLEGRAVQGFRPADTRSKFIEAFHQLLRLCTEFYTRDDQTTVKADAFGVLNALKEVHLILSQGAHSQFGDLPGTSRVEFLMQQWLMSRSEFREFLPTRVMVAYPEPWMDRVDAMKKLQNWTDTSIIHFHNLAVFGEQILLSIRYGAWSVVFEPTQAFNFARFWRPQIQGYIHAYRAATGVELGAQTVDTGVDSTLPSVLLQKRLSAQQRSL
jgi:hypothetical protein